jgi:hypothetical protein
MHERCDILGHVAHVPGMLRPAHACKQPLHTNKCPKDSESIYWQTTLYNWHGIGIIAWGARVTGRGTPPVGGECAIARVFGSTCFFFFPSHCDDDDEEEEA